MIERCSFVELEAAPQWPALIAEYSAEAGNPLMPPVNYDPDTYRRLCEAGQLHSYAVNVDTSLIGFMLLLDCPMHKYSAKALSVEAIFVAGANRMSGAGVRLLRKAEEVARERGCVGLFASSPAGGALGEVLPRMGFVESNRIFCKPIEKRDLIQLLEVPPSPPAVIDAIRKMEAQLLELEQIDMVTSHRIHARMYSRTILVPAGIVVTAAVIKIATQLTIAGDCEVFLGHEWMRITGYAVLTASAGRKQMARAIGDTFVTMSFGTNAKTIAEAEAEFTDEGDQMWSRRGINDVLITEE